MYEFVFLNYRCYQVIPPWRCLIQAGWGLMVTLMGDCVGKSGSLEEERFEYQCMCNSVHYPYQYELEQIQKWLNAEVRTNGCCQYNEYVGSITVVLKWWVGTQKSVAGQFSMGLEPLLENFFPTCICLEKYRDTVCNMYVINNLFIKYYIFV